MNTKHRAIITDYPFSLINKIKPTKMERPKIISIQNLYELQEIVKKGDLVVFDIDQTILVTGTIKYGNKAIVSGLCPQLPALIADWKKTFGEEIDFLILTARKLKYMDDTVIQLKKINMDGIFVIHAENNYGISTKGEELVNYLELAFLEKTKPKRVVFVDDMLKNHIDVSNNLTKFKIPYLCIQKQSCFQITTSGNEHIFPKVITDLDYINTLSGGSGGVYLLIDSKTGYKYTLKTSTNTDHIKEEILADGLYQSLGVKVPPFAVYDHLPYSIKWLVKETIQESKSTNKPTNKIKLTWKDFRSKHGLTNNDFNQKDWNDICAFYEIKNYIKPVYFEYGPGPYRLSLFIESCDKPDYTKFSDHFVADALMSNWDIPVGNYKNVIVDKNLEIWRIDNGGSLRYRALGELKTKDDGWCELQVPELETMRDKNINSGANAYSSITEGKIKSQIEDLLTKKNEFFNTFNRLSKCLGIRDSDKLRDIMIDKFEYLQSKITSNGWLRKITDKSAAGALILAQYQGKFYTLFGQRKGHNWWGNFGGKSDTTDEFLSITAQREIQEESLGYIHLTKTVLDQSFYHDLINYEGILYRMYIVKLQNLEHFIVNGELSTIKIQTAVNEKKYNWNHEYTKYLWVDLALLISSISDPIFSVEENKKVCSIILPTSNNTITIHPPLFEMLTQPKVIDFLGKFNVSKPKLLYNNSIHHHPLVLAESTLKHMNIVIMKADKINSKSLYTPNEIYLSSRFNLTKDKLSNLKDDYKAQVKYYTVRTGFTYNKYGSLEIFEATMEKVLIKENDMRDYNTFYHGADDKTCFIYALITMFKQLLYRYNTVSFRILDEPFDKYADVHEFINSFKHNDGYVYNYEIKGEYSYADMGLSVNPFLFGNDNNETSSSCNLFWGNTTGGPTPNYENLIEEFGQLMGITINYKNYESIYKQYFVGNSRLYQIFVDPDLVDKIAYTAVSGGDLMRSNVSYSFRNFFDKAKIDPNNATKWINSAKSTKHNSFNINEMQGRLYLKPELTKNLKVIHYNRRSDFQEKMFNKILFEQVSLDISMWLWKSNCSRKAKTPVQIFYNNILLSFVCKTNNGVSVHSLQPDLSILLFNAINTSNFIEFKNLVEENNINFTTGVLSQRINRRTKKIHNILELICATTKTYKKDFLKICIEHKLPITYKEIELIVSLIKENEFKEWSQYFKERVNEDKLRLSYINEKLVKFLQCLLDVGCLKTICYLNVVTSESGRLGELLAIIKSKNINIFSSCLCSEDIDVLYRITTANESMLKIDSITITMSGNNSLKFLKFPTNSTTLPHNIFVDLFSKYPKQTCDYLQFYCDDMGELKISACDDDNFEILVDALIENKNIKILNIITSKITDKVVPLLIRLLEQNKDINIKLHATSMTFSGKLKIHHHFPLDERAKVDFKLNSTNKNFFLSEITDALESGLWNPLTINIAKYDFKQELMEKFLQSMFYNKSVKALDVSGISCIANCQHFLKELLEKNQHLEELYIREIGLNSNWIEIFSSGLKLNTTLKILSLWKNNLNDDHIELLSNSLTNNTTLEALTLSKNKISDQGLISIMNFLSSNGNRIKILKLGRNKEITENSYDLILQTLLNHKHIVEIKFEGTNFKLSHKKVSQLKDLLGTHSSLKKFNITYGVGEVNAL